MGEPQDYIERKGGCFWIVIAAIVGFTLVSIAEKLSKAKVDLQIDAIEKRLDALEKQ